MWSIDSQVAISAFTVQLSIEILLDNLVHIFETFFNITERYFSF